MAAPVAETYNQITLAANANANCSVGPGVLGGIFVSSASNTPLLTVLDAAAPVAGNTGAIAAQFVPVAATWYRLPARFSTGLQVVIGGNVTYTVFYNK